MARKKSSRPSERVAREYKGHAPSESEVRDAISVLTRDYYDDVRGVAGDLADRIAEGEIPDREGFEDALHEDVDSTQRVIYTFQAKCGMLVTEHADQYEDEYGEPPPTIEAAMHAAMKRDVMDFMEREYSEQLESLD